MTHVFAGPGRGRDTVVVVDGRGLHAVELTDAESARASALLVDGGDARDLLGPEAWFVRFEDLRRVDGRLLGRSFRVRAEGRRARTLTLIDRKTRDAVLGALEGAWPGVRGRREKRRELLIPLGLLGLLIGAILVAGRPSVWASLAMGVWYGSAWLSYATDDRLILEARSK